MDALTPFPDPRDQVQYQRTREMTIDELLLENRVVFLVGEISYASAARVMMQMLYLEDQRRGQDINLYINSPGGSLDDTLAVYDTMQFLSSDVATYCIGVTGQTTDIQIQAEQIIKAKQTLNEIISRHTGQTIEQVAEDGDRDRYFTAQEAKAYGLVDEVFQPKEPEKPSKDKKDKKKDS
ncbi:MAG: ClpP family protease [Planctomycetota bacterium]|jgi:ATP-dependent Clp protease protease subunit